MAGTIIEFIFLVGLLAILTMFLVPIIYVIFKLSEKIDRKLDKQ